MAQTPSTPLDKNLTEEEEALQLDLSTLNGAYAFFFSAPILVIVLYFVLDDYPAKLPTLVGWFVLSLSTPLMLTVLAGRRALETLSARRRRWLSRLFRLSDVAVPFSWGITSWLFSSHLSREMNMLLATATVAYSAGAIVSFLLIRRTMFLIATLTGLVFCSGMVANGTLFHALLSLCVMATNATVLAVMLPQSNTVRTSLRMRFANEKLLAESVAQQAALQAARSESDAARKAAELASGAKTRFLAAASHDLRQPMHALLMYHQRLAGSHGSDSTSPIVEKMGRALSSMQAMLDSMLEMSRLISGQVTPLIANAATEPLMQRLESQLAGLAAQKGLHFTIDQRPAYVRTDEVILERVLRNLAINAIKNTFRGGVTIRVRIRTDHVSFQVWDTGIGIRREDQEKIFEEYFQIGNEARDAKLGLGLGLSLVRENCRLLGMHLRLRSTPGVGSVFVLRVPIGNADLRADLPTSDKSLPNLLLGATIYVVDDNASVIDATAGMLRELGARVVTASSAEEAVESLVEGESFPHLVLSDYRLAGGRTGLEAIASIRNTVAEITAEDMVVPAIILTGDTSADIMVRLQESGYTVLHKPVSPAVLISACNRELRLMARGISG